LDPEIKRMEIQETLSEATEQPGEESLPVARTDGLAASIAVEHQPEAGAATSAGNHPANPKRPGRPPIHGRYSQAAGSDGKNPIPLPGSGALQEVETAAAAQPRVTLPPDLVTKVVFETLTLGENFAGNKVEAVAVLAGLTTTEIEPQLKQVLLGKERKQLVADLTPFAMKEWGMDPEMSPTAAIGLLLGPWAFGAVTAYLTLAKLAEQKLTMEKQRGKEK